MCLAYFTRALKEFKLDRNQVSGKIRKTLSGFASNYDLMTVYLIGLLSKNFEWNSGIGVADIMDFIYSVINSVHDAIGGRIILFECEDIPQLIKGYASVGFKRLQQSLKWVDFSEHKDPHIINLSK